MAYMKSLSLAKPLVLVIVGLPGAGKSFFARQFSETFSAPVVSINQLAYLLESENGKDEQKKAMQLATYQLEELLKTHKTILVDGIGATQAERVELRKIAKNKGYDVLLVWVQTDTTTAQFRSMRRSKQRLDDKFNASMSAEEYDKAARRFHPPLANEPSIVISGKHTYATQAKIILKKLAGPREAQIAPRTMVSHGTRSSSGSKDQTNNSAASRRNVLIR